MTYRLSRNFGSWLVHHAWEFKWHYFGALSCLYVLQQLQSEIPEQIRNLTKLIEVNRLHEASVWIFVGLALGIFVFRTLSRMLFFFPARVQQKLLRMEILEQIEKVPGERYATQSQGQIFQILFDDINNLRALVGFSFLQVANVIFAAVVLIPKINSSDPYLWPAFIPLFLSFPLTTAMTFWNQKINRQMMKKKGDVQQFVIESYVAKQSIKNFHREDTFIEGFIKLSREELALFFRSAVGSAITSSYLKLGLGASLLWGALLVKSRGGSPSDLIYFSGFLFLFLEPIMMLSWVAMIASQGWAAWTRIKGLHTSLNAPSSVENELEDSPLEDLSTTLKFWGRPQSFNFTRGKWTVLIGETGAGKSYLLAKLATILILKRRVVSMVQQEPYLFNDTVAENIFLGTKGNIELAKELITMFQLDSIAEGLDAVLALEVGENGKRLSGGQMKRVALIRSLLSGADTLIWDDPFSSVDILLEKKIVKALKEKFPGKTVILSSHRLTTVRLSDEVIFLDREQGIPVRGEIDNVLKEPIVTEFFKEQMVDVPLA